MDLNAAMSGRRIPPPIAELLGMTFVSAADGTAVITMDVSERYANPMGTLHGGVLCDLADFAMGAAYASTLAEGESFTTLELKINFLKPIWRAHLQATGRVVRSGNTVGLTECDIVDEAGSLVARASCTCLTLRGEHAAGR